MKKDKINILFVMMQMAMGGSERLVHNLALVLDRTVFNPSVAWFHGTHVLQEFLDLEIPLYHVPKARRFDFSAMQTIARIINENRIAVVNAHHFMPMVYSFYGSKIKNNANLVYTEHSEWEIERIPWRWRKIGGRLLNRSDAVVGVSSPIAARLQHTFNTPASKTIAIPNGVNCQAFTMTAHSSLKNELGITDNDLVIGTVANFKKIKNHLLLLKAFKEIIKKSRNAKLLLVGQGFENDPENTEPQIRHYIQSHGLSQNVLLTGYRADIASLLQIMNVFCLTSFKEGLPIGLIEAMAAGLPVVGTDTEGIRDAVIPDTNGFLVGMDDAEGLKKILLRLLEDAPLRRRFGIESRRLAQERYSLQRCVNDYQTLFASF